MEVYTQTDLNALKDHPWCKKLKKKKDRKFGLAAVPAKKKKIVIGKTITVFNLAKEMGVKASDVIKVLMELGVMANQNQYISAEEAVLVSQELGFELEEARDEIKETYLTPPTT
jgi:translation initiation factor IF-2